MQVNVTKRQKVQRAILLEVALFKEQEQESKQRI